MKPQEYAIYNSDELQCQHPEGQIRIADDNTGAYCRKCCDWISVTAVATSTRIGALEAHNAELIVALTRICANPMVQDLIEADKRTNYLIRDAREILTKVTK